MTTNETTNETTNAIEANDAIVRETTKRAKREARVYTNARFVAANAESRMVDAIRKIAKRGDAATCRAIFDAIRTNDDTITYRGVRQVLRRFVRHAVVDVRIDERSDGRRVRSYTIAKNAK